MNILVKIEDTAADDSIHKLIDRRIKEILLNDKHIQSRIDALLDAQISKRATWYLERYFGKGEYMTTIVDKIIQKAGLNLPHMTTVVNREIRMQVTKLVADNGGNEAAIRQLFKDEVKALANEDTQESEG